MEEALSLGIYSLEWPGWDGSLWGWAGTLGSSAGSESELLLEHELEHVSG